MASKDIESTDGTRVALLGFGTVGQSVARILCSGEVPRRPPDAHFQPPGRPQARRLGAVVGVLDRIGRRDPRLRRRHRDRARRRTASGVSSGCSGALLAGKSVVTANKQLMAHHGSELHRPGARAGARGAVRGLGGRRHSGAARAAGRARRRSARRSARHPERHLRLHPQPHAVGADLVRRRARRSAGRRLRRSRSERGRRRRRCRRQAGDHRRRRPAPPGSRRRHRHPVDPADRSRSTSNTPASWAAPSGRSRAPRPRTDGAVFAAVRPALVPLSSSFGRIEGSQNLVTVRGIFGGETSFSGSGAGGSPTAVAVVSDVLSVAAAAATRSRRSAGADDLPPGERRLRRAALRALHRQRQAGHPVAGHRRLRQVRHQHRRRAAAAASSARIGCRSSPRSRSAPSRCSIARSPKSPAATITCSRRWRCRSSPDMAMNVPSRRRVQRGRRGRRAPDRLADPERRVRHGGQERRVVRRAASSTSAAATTSRRRSRCGSRRRPSRCWSRCSRSWSRSAAAWPISTMRSCSRPTATAACPTTSTRPPTTARMVRHGGQWIEVERQRMDAVDRASTSGRAVVPQAARRPRRRAGRLRRRRHPRHPRSSRSATATASRS